MNRKLTKILALATLAALLAAASPTTADDADPPDERLRGTASLPKPAALSHGANAYAVSYGPLVGPYDVVAAGTGLRNSGTGSITLPALAGPVIHAYLYWVILEPVALLPSQIAFVNGIPVVGTLIGSDVDLCWGGGWAWAYRADVTALVTGPGPYVVTTVSGNVGGVDPWFAGSVAPMAEGASIVAVVKEPRDVLREVVIVDGFESAIGTTATAILPRVTPTFSKGVLTAVGADGQTEASEETFWNGASLALDSWDGSDPQIPPPYTFGNLWDTDRFDVLVVPGGNQVDVVSYGDCVGPEAFALAAFL